MKKYKNIKIYFLRASVALCPKKVILVVRSALATLDPSRINVNLYVNRRQSTLIIQE